MPGNHVATATIPSSTGAGPTSSSAVDLSAALDQYRGWHVGVASTASFDGTITVQVDQTSTGSWVDLAQDGSTSAVTVPSGGARLARNVPFPRLRLQSSTGESANRDFRIWVQ